MKIAMMTNNYKPFVAGVPISVEKLSVGLRALGHQVTVFAPSYDEQDTEEDVIRYGALLKGVAGGFSVPNSLDPKIERAFWEGHFDVIHVHHPMMIGATARYLSWKYHVPLVSTYHTRYEQYLHYVGLTGLERFWPIYLRRTLGACNMVFAPTPHIRDYLRETGINPPIEVLPTGLSKTAFYPDQQKAKRLREQFCEGRPFLFCTVARLAKEKNLEFLLESLALYKQKAGPCFKLLLIGKGPYREKLCRRIGELALTEEIILTGEVRNEDMKEYCAASDLFLFSSRSETQGIVLLEAMAVGTPVLALRATGTDDIVINGVNGYMTQVSGDSPRDRIQDARVFADKAMAILSGKELETLKQGAKETANKYDCQEIAERASSYYREVIWEYEMRRTRYYGRPART
jgi:glycosyltransferase involved in cell wall biosynthesis